MKSWSIPLALPNRDFSLWETAAPNSISSFMNANLHIQTDRLHKGIYVRAARECFKLRSFADFRKFTCTCAYTHKANQCVPITDLFFHSRVCASIRSHYVQNAIWKTPEEKYLIKYKYVIN